jgi:hypothetical protein
VSFFATQKVNLSVLLVVLMHYGLLREVFMKSIAYYSQARPYQHNRDFSLSAAEE